MGIRDLFLFAIILGGIPFMVRRPYIGVLYWVWLAMMNPHRLAYGAAYEFPFAYVVAIATLAGLVFTREERRFKGGLTIFVLLIFVGWMSLTTLFALNPADALAMWERVVKIQLMTIVAVIALNSREQIQQFVWVLVLSLGFYGVKGGLFTVLSGGNFLVWGPPGSFIEDNNTLALALVMVIPLMYYLLEQSKVKWVKLGFAAAMFLCAASALGSHSRGALLAIGAMSIYLWWRLPRKLISGIAIIMVGISLVSFMPDSWNVRMRTINSYQLDASAMGRLNAWNTAINIAEDRPAIGAGFEFYTRPIFAKYAPDPNDLHTAHSIYFQVLGEHGFVGLGLFLVFWICAWRNASGIIKSTKGQEQYTWASSLAKMIQVSLIGYAVGGTFLNLAYWDGPYYEVVILVVVRDIVRRALRQTSPNQQGTGAESLAVVAERA